MTRIAVNSSNLASVGYEEESKTLEIEFNSGSIYQYFNVPFQEYQNLMQADSHGKYFDRNIKHNYSYRKVR